MRFVLRLRRLREGPVGRRPAPPSQRSAAGRCAPAGAKAGRTQKQAGWDGRIVSCVCRDSFDPFRPFPAPGVSEPDFVSALGLAKRLNFFRPFPVPGVSEPDFVSVLGLAKRLNFFRPFPAPGVSEPDFVSVLGLAKRLNFFRLFPAPVVPEPDFVSGFGLTKRLNPFRPFPAPAVPENDFVSALGLAKRNFRFLHPHPRTSSGTVFVFPLGKSNT